MENRTARLTILIDPRKKSLFDEICAQQDLTPSQVVRRLIRQYIVDNAAGRELPGGCSPTRHATPTIAEPGTYPGARRPRKTFAPTLEIGVGRHYY